MGPKRNNNRGFTLVEATISLAVLALMFGVVLSSFGAARADLRKAAGQLDGTIRATYDTAALTGQTYRLVFSFDKDEETGEYKNHTVRVEATEQLLSFDEDQNPLSRGAKGTGNEGGIGFGLGTGGFAFAGMDANELDDELDELEDLGPPSALQALIGLNDRAAGEVQSAFQATENNLDLGDDVHVLDVWIRGMREPVSEGESYLYFFPHGYTQDAYIHLEDDDDTVFTIVVHALTGKTEIHTEYKEVPK